MRTNYYMHACTHTQTHILLYKLKLEMLQLRKNAQRMQMFDIALVEMTCHRRIGYDVAHVKVGMVGLYAVRIAMIEHVALRGEYTLAVLEASVDVQLLVSDDELWSTVLERSPAPATLILP